MKLLEIKVATNGFVAYTEDEWGMESTSIHQNLLDLALFTGETLPEPQKVDKDVVHYDDNLMYPKERLKDIRNLAIKGDRIEAIKLFRTMFTHTVGLKAAKDIVEFIAEER